MKQIDLHVHSSCSDGTLSPAKLVRLAKDCGLAAFALTDHDTTGGLPEALSAAACCGIEVIPGIEFSAEYHGRDIHIIGLEPDWTHPDFQETLKYYRAERFRRNQRMIDRMAADGIDISYEKMKARFSGESWTRAHFARYLAEHGYVGHMQDAFTTHVGPGCPYYVPREKISPLEAVQLIRRFHGIPVLAHPLQYRLSEEELHTLLKQLCAAGLIGMEVFYSTHTEEQTDYLLALARQYGLMPGGGSDFHGSNKPDIALGTGKNNLHIPYQILTDLRRKKHTAKNKEDCYEFS